MTKKGSGKGLAWIKENISYVGENCLIWPYSKEGNGYGQLGYNGQIWKAHKLMCAMVYGNRRYPDFEVRHSCRNRACCNPSHLSWGTRSDNGLDKRKDGTWQRRPKRFKLNPTKAAEIRALKGTRTLKSIAEEYGVSEPTIQMIMVGKIWKPERWAELQHSYFPSD
jgi:hypothetical protein